MLPLDLSTVNIFLIGAVIALFIVFVMILMKLNPSTEKKEKREHDITIESRKPPQPPISPRTPPTVKTDAPKTVAKPIVSSSTVVAPVVKPEQKPLAPVRGEIKEAPKHEITPTAVKKEAAPSKRDCLHHFGYLRTLPKNAPIPDECFGCPKIVDCLVNTKTRG